VTVEEQAGAPVDISYRALLAQLRDRIAELTPAHWKVIEWCRAHAVNGRSPTLRQITEGTGISTKEMFALFPKGPAKKVPASPA
jgi:sulfur relay (sulfurtransferase) DsrC/TusE family protein